MQKYLRCHFYILDENMSSWSSGASVLDLIFPQPETVSEIRFRNWYTARLSLLVRFDDSAQSPPKREHLAWAAAAVGSIQHSLSTILNSICNQIIMIDFQATPKCSHSYFIFRALAQLACVERTQRKASQSEGTVSKSINETLFL